MFAYYLMQKSHGTDRHGARFLPKEKMNDNRQGNCEARRKKSHVNERETKHVIGTECPKFEIRVLLYPIEVNRSEVWQGPTFNPRMLNHRDHRGNREHFDLSSDSEQLSDIECF